MPTDPFSDIAFQQEIGQPTFAELIYTEVRNGKSFPPSTATVENSVNRLAYGKPGPYRDIDAQTPPKLVAIQPSQVRRKYSLSGSATPQTAEALRIQRIQADFRKLVINPGSDTQIQNIISKQSSEPVCNLIVNPTFDENIDNWIPGNNFTTPDASWNQDTGRIRLMGGTYVTQTLTGLTPGARYTLECKVYFPPTTLNGGGVIGTAVLACNGDDTQTTVNGTLPGDQLKNLQLTGFVPDSGSIQVVLSNYNNGLLVINPVDFDDVSLCLYEDSSQGTNPECNKLPNGFFDENIDGWQGNSSAIYWNGSTKRMHIRNGLAYYTITGLTPGKKLNISMKVYFQDIEPNGDTIPEDATWDFYTTVRADTLLDGTILGEETITATQNTTHSLSYDPQATVPPSGIVYLLLQGGYYTASPNVYFTNIEVDEIVVCEIDDPKETCVEPITAVRTMIQWNGIPRQPVNIFNKLLRLTYRDQNDPLSKTVVDVLPTGDGRLGTVTPSACSVGDTIDFWKQQGMANAPETIITNKGLNTTTSNNIVAGQLSDVASRNNWLWAIPGSTTGTLQDALVTLWPDGESGILESIEILMLAQTANDTGNTTRLGFLQYVSSTNVSGKPALVTLSMTSAELAANGTNSGFSNIPRGDYYRSVNGITPAQGTTIEKNALGNDWARFYYIGSRDFIFANPIDLNGNTLTPPYSAIQCLFASRQQIIDPSYLQVICYLIIDGEVVDSNSSPIITQSENLDGDEFSSNVIFANFPATIIKPVTNFTIRVELFGKLYNGEFGPIPGIGFPEIDYFPNYASLNGIHEDAPSDLVCAGPFGSAIDPSQNFDLILRYTNSRGQAKEFRKTFNKTTLHQNFINFPATPDTWDRQIALGNGVLGSIARWESAKFVLDAVNGSGLDQCTIPLEFSTTGTGRLNFNKFSVRGRGTSAAICDARLEVTEVSKGTAINEIQSVVLPSPSGGTWTLTFNFAGTTGTTTPIPWDAVAVQVRNRLEALPSIGDGNVKVTGDGTSEAPFVIEFIGTLGGRDLRPLVADGSNLTGASSAFAVKVSTGTTNERQTITKNSGINNDLLVTFSGVQSQPIAFDSSLNEMQSALEGMSTIGPGNVLVTGTTTDRDADYQGPWYVDFIGALTGQNVSTYSTQTIGYSVVTNWQGGAGINDVQKVIVSASAGSFKLIVTKPGAIPDVTGFDAQTSSFVGGVKITWTPDLTPGMNIKVDDSADGVTWNIATGSSSASSSEIHYTALPASQQRFFRARFTDGTNFSANYATDDAVAGNGSTPTPPPPAPPPPAPPPSNGSSTTDPIGINAGAQQIKEKILAVADWLVANDLVVTRLPDTTSAPDLNQWTIEFTGNWAKQNIPLIGVQDVNLHGARAIISELSKGSGSNERQKVNILKAAGGTYRLKVTIDNMTGTTVLIPWNASAEGVQLALQALPLFPLSDDVSVKDVEIREPNVVNSFVVSFNRRFGDVPLMETVNSLQCNPLTLSAVGPPPYDYKLPECDEDVANLFCSPGELLCRPGEGDPETPDEICCDPVTIRDSANYYREVVLQRDLFDPNHYTTSGRALTIKDMAVLKGLRPSQYNAYLRDFYTGVLRPVDMATTVETKMSVLLIGTDIDTKVTRERLGRELKRRPGVLPSRMVWSNPALQE